jgi:hypothetical protein
VLRCDAERVNVCSLVRDAQHVAAVRHDPTTQSGKRRSIRNQCLRQEMQSNQPQEHSSKWEGGRGGHV